MTDKSNENPEMQASRLAAANPAVNMGGVIERLDRIEHKLDQLTADRTPQDYYSTTQVAKLLGKAEFTVREWCRLGRVHAAKRPCGRGNSQEWMLSASEVGRIRSEGLLRRTDILPSCALRQTNVRDDSRS